MAVVAGHRGYRQGGADRVGARGAVLRPALDVADPHLSTYGKLVLGFVVLIGLMTWHIRSITQSESPALRAMEGLALAVPLFILLFASTYYLMSQADEASFRRRCLGPMVCTLRSQSSPPSGSGTSALAPSGLARGQRANDSRPPLPRPRGTNPRHGRATRPGPAGEQDQC